MDHPIFLLPNIWLCSKHPGCRQHCGLPKHNTGLPAATGKKPLVFHLCEYTFSIDLAGILFEMHSNFFAVYVYLIQPDNFPYKDEIAALSNLCLVLIVLLFISCILSFKVLSFASFLHTFSTTCVRQKGFIIVIHIYVTSGPFCLSNPLGWFLASHKFHSRCSPFPSVEAVHFSAN